MKKAAQEPKVTENPLYPSESRNIGEVYKLLVLNAEKELDNRFSMLPASHPARAPYALFSQSSDTVRSGVIIGLGSRLQVFQNLAGLQNR